VGRPAVKQWIDDTIAAGATTIFDGDFEAPIVTGGSQQHDAPTSIGAWRVTAGSVDMVREDYWSAYHGAQSVDLNGCSRGRISQDITVEPGRQYTVSFAYSGNPADDRGIKRFHVEINGNPVGQPFSFDTSTNTRTDMGWKQGQLGFSSSGGSIELAFASDGDGCFGPAFDDVKVEPLTIR
jgi:choice-of-anchor C domain-containing protein